MVQVAGDSTSAGTALLAGLGAGGYRDPAEAAAACYRPVRSAEPDPANRELYDDMYQRYMVLVGAPMVRAPREAIVRRAPEEY